MKLSHRLQTINQMISQHYDHIWDCCCDHGLLGTALLDRKITDKVHFVDIVPELIAQLATQLQQHYSDRKDWQVYCQDVAALPLSNAIETGAKQLVIIAGVGGDLTIDFVSAILKAHPALELEFILCPVYHQYKLRQALIELKLGLIDEKLICENNRYYEILHVSTRSSQSINLVGDKMWDFSRKVDQDYLAKTLQHYQRMANNPDLNIQEIIQAYQAIKPDL